MRHLGTYLLLRIGGNPSPTAADITNALSQCGIEVDTERLDQLIGDLEGKDINEIYEMGKDKLVACGGGGAAAPAASSGATAAVVEVKVPEKPKEEEVDALDGGMDMFGGSGGGGDY
mmetsp:Transcript_22667/g.22867  ORF Transcript_22667/g.22867 Transcript_22667/m.22867 type:complete len:117 (+) Transcript_22667:129-479(+)|eukprot:CAMPEP_0182416110 /NCGR_PEP_ID=MMETSP1167-20130531/213_1 /TAXON_ID=2988 /ORGANISM="Mallomonas Sp, Strain CCMP3275" /LENGTH=116 /DNA_ID=CAMNT_0024588539 /DNA_START=97 /DNA_END=447 /DNA_ORIENTATION=+